MIRLLQSLFQKGGEATTPANRLLIDLATIEGALVKEKEFRRPQWKIIRSWIKEHTSPDNLESAWQGAVFDWLSKLQADLGAKFSLSESKNFFLLTSRGPNAAKSILRTSESAVQLLTNWLGSIAEKRGHGKHVILDFDTEENYYIYRSYFYPSDSPIIASGGVFIPYGYQHIALPPAERTQDILIHELTHNRLAHLPLPSWLNEGIAVNMERRIGGNKQGTLDRDLLQRHRKYWTKETINGFWAGTSFHDKDGAVIHLSYSLAEILVDLLVQEFANFMDFVACANWKDAGQAALNENFGVTLNDVAETFLGPGDWSPSVQDDETK